MGFRDKLQSLFKSKRVNIANRFELLREAISGTMSNFYMAKDRERNEVVGLKIADQEKLAHFESRFTGLNKPPEGDIAMQINHPLIVKTYEHGFTTDGLRYIVMEYVKGVGLHQVVYNKDKEIEGKRLKVVRDMATAIAHVHKSGFIHRDVCPRNFIVNNACTEVKLIDFGLTLPDLPAFKQPGNRTGTPLYMAPEVVRRRNTDNRLDVFSLGVTAYHVLTFNLPWPVSETSGLAALAHDTAKPAPLSEFRPTINKTLEKAVLKCIESNPKARPTSVEQFLKLIRDVKHEDE